MATSHVATLTSAGRVPSTSRVVCGPGHLFSHPRRQPPSASSCRPGPKRLCAQSSVVDALNATHGGYKSFGWTICLRMTRLSCVINPSFAGISGHVQFVSGPGNLPVAKLTHACGASAQVRQGTGCTCGRQRRPVLRAPFMPLSAPPRAPAPGVPVWRSGAELAASLWRRSSLCSARRGV